AGWGEFFHNYFVYKDLINDEAPHTPHNFPLTLGSQCGLTAFLFSCLLILLPFVIGFLLLKKQGTMYRETPEEKEDYILKLGLVTGFSSWFFHCLCEIDYETPGSFCTAAAVAFLIMNSKDMERFFPRFSFAVLEEKKYFGKLKFALFFFFILFSLGILAWIGWKAPVLISGEMAFDRLFTGVNPHFGRLGEKMVQPEEAARLFQETVKRIPRSPFPWDTVSHYVAAMGPDHAYDAIALVEEARKRSPRRASYYYRQSQAYRRLGNIPKAVEMLKKAQQCSPKNPEYFDEEQNWNIRYEDSGSLW
ncbi:MAG: tetratricopeptide repeat protein, partial [Lentisphaeria bacterium]|nr:tetratricopeptide repeat protein [Lentisphaeria bacterium]